MNRGVLHFDGETWTTYTEDNGLPNNDVGALAVAPDGTIWAGTREGISRFDTGSWLFYPIGEP
ncbi:MAG: two-component regulator propeller domain-containing protein [Anaerolineae bacterium]